jgi:hypothetical protein
MMSLPNCEFAAFIGHRLADSKHDICLQVANTEKRELPARGVARVGQIRGADTGQDAPVSRESCHDLSSCLGVRSTS